MKTKTFFEKTSMTRQNLHYHLKIAFGLFFLFPVLGFICLAFRYDFVQDVYFSYYLLGFLCFSFAGFYLLRRLFDQIRDLSEKLTNPFAVDKPRTRETADEIQAIVSSFAGIEKRFHETSRQLERKITELSVLKELSELFYITFDDREILQVTLERALMLTDADIGSVMLRDPSDPDVLVVKACIGLGELVKMGDRVDLDDSIAKYAVLNKSPLVIDNIETDIRFGRHNRHQYGTKSFVIMPIKTSKEVMGVLTLSRRKKDTAFSQRDVEVLTPLLSNAAFTYDNLRLLRENRANREKVGALNKIVKMIHSNVQEDEAYQAVLTEVQHVLHVPFAAILSCPLHNDRQWVVTNLFSSRPVRLTNGGKVSLDGATAERILGQGSPLLIEDLDRVSHELDLSFLKEEGIRSCWMTALKPRDAAPKLLLLASWDLDVSQEHRTFLEVVSHIAAFGMERKELVSAISKRKQEMDTIRQIGSLLASSTFDMEKVLKCTMDMTREILNVEAGSLLLLKGKVLEVVHAFNLDMKTLKDFRLKLGEGIAGYVAARGMPLIENDISSSPHSFSGVDRATGFQARSVLCVPIISQGRVMGVIEVLNKIEGDFSGNDMELLQSISSSMSIAMENLRLYKETVMMAERERSIRGVFQKFVPKEIVNKIIYDQTSGREETEETKTLTLLNLDVRGFTRLSRELGPQKTVSLLNNFFSVMGQLVFKYHGIVDKYLGDGFLALFGAPVSSTRDADNAVSAALEMKASLPQVEDEAVRELGLSVNIGITIHTGEVVVGNFGFEKKMDYTVIGDPVNTVFRMQKLTRTIPNSVLISEKTRHAARSALNVRQIDSHNVEGMETMKVYELLGKKDP